MFLEILAILLVGVCIIMLLVAMMSPGGDSLGLAAVALFAILCMFVFFRYGVEDVRKEAIKAGVAHYVGDPVTGKSTFTWKTIETEK